MSRTRTGMELSLPAVPTSVRETRAEITAVLVELGVDERVRDDIRLCISEAVTNVVRHAYPLKPGMVQVVLEQVGPRIDVTVTDSGSGIGGKREPSELGGYGLEIMKQLTSQFDVRSTPEAGTTISMSFSAPPSSGAQA